MSNNYKVTSNILNKMRSLNEEYKKRNNTLSVINESTSTESATAIAITDDPKFGDKVLTNQINQFQTSVDSSASFNSSNPDNPADNPLIYMPETSNIVFSGTIPTLNNLKWQFVLIDKSGAGCYVFADGLSLNKENLMILNKLHGFYLNWCEQWRQSAKELAQLKSLKK